MARLNVDYAAVRVDPRFRALSRKLGCEGKAWEMVLRFWDMAQKHWGQGSPIPRKIFDLEGDLGILLEVDLAVEIEGGIYARGSKEQFDWYRQRVESGRRGGQKSIQSRIEKYGSSDPHVLRSKQEAVLQESRSKPEAPPEAAKKPLTPTLTPSLYREALPDGNAMSPPGRRRGLDPTPLVHLWNELAHPNMPRVDDFKSGQPRYRSARSRLLEKPELEYWRGVIERMNVSSFCRGEVTAKDGRKAWVGNFEFMVRPDSARKVLAGNYDDPGQSPGARDWKDMLSPEVKTKYGLT